jgi:hypothetical protein
MRESDSSKYFEIAKKITQVRQNQLHSLVIEVGHMFISSVNAVLCFTDGYATMKFIFNCHAMLFDQGGTAKSRNFAHVRVHRRRVHRPPAFEVFQVLMSALRGLTY